MEAKEWLKDIVVCSLDRKAAKRVDMKAMYLKDPELFFKTALVLCSWCREKVPYRTKDGIETVDVLGIRNIKMGMTMLFRVLCEDPGILYRNLPRIGVLFGGWGIVFRLWSYCLVGSKLDAYKCKMEHKRAFRSIYRAAFDPLVGPDYCKALPLLRDTSEVKTDYRKSMRIIAKLMRSQYFVGDKAFSNRRYRRLKGLYGHKIAKFKKLSISNMRDMYDMDELFDKLVNQPAFDYLYLGGKKKGKGFIFIENPEMGKPDIKEKKNEERQTEN